MNSNLLPWFKIPNEKKIIKKKLEETTSLLWVILCKHEWIEWPGSRGRRKRPTGLWNGRCTFMKPDKVIWNFRAYCLLSTAASKTQRLQTRSIWDPGKKRRLSLARHLWCARMFISKTKAHWLKMTGNWQFSHSAILCDHGTNWKRGD